MSVRRRARPGRNTKRVNAYETRKGRSSVSAGLQAVDEQFPLRVCRRLRSTAFERRRRPSGAADRPGSLPCAAGFLSLRRSASGHRCAAARLSSGLWTLFHPVWKVIRKRRWMPGVLVPIAWLFCGAYVGWSLGLMGVIVGAALALSVWLAFRQLIKRTRLREVFETVVLPQQRPH